MSEFVAKIVALRDEAHVLKEKCVRDMDFEAAARWRDVANDLDKAIVTATVKPPGLSIGLIVETDKGEWITLPPSSSG